MSKRDLTLIEAFRIWAGTSPDRYHARNAAWDVYVAVRDGKEIPEPENRRKTHRDIGRGEDAPREVAFPPNPHRKIMQ